MRLYVVKVIQHRYPLHRISYCADDKSDKRMFTFVAKEGESNYCFVFDSEKCVSIISAGYLHFLHCFGVQICIFLN